MIDQGRKTPRLKRLARERRVEYRLLKFRRRWGYTFKMRMVYRRRDRERRQRRLEVDLRFLTSDMPVERYYAELRRIPVQMLRDDLKRSGKIQRRPPPASPQPHRQGTGPYGGRAAGQSHPRPGPR